MLPSMLVKVSNRTISEIYFVAFHSPYILACNQRNCTVKNTCQGLSCSFCHHTMIWEHFETHLQECKQNSTRIWRTGCYTLADFHEEVISSDHGAESEENQRFQCQSSQPNSPLQLPSFSPHTLDDSLKNLSHEDQAQMDSSGELYETRDGQKDQIYYGKKKLKKEISNFIMNLQEKHSLNRSELVTNILQILLDSNQPDNVLLKFGYINLKTIKTYLPLLK